MDHKLRITNPLKRLPWVAAAVYLPAVPILSPVAFALEIRTTFQQEEIRPLKPHQCPRRCDLLFAMLEDGPQGNRGANIQQVQHVEVQERGGPESGTGFMLEWATGALAYSCIYLQKAYGKKSCRIEWNPHNRTLAFEPSLVVEEETKPPCSCDAVERVTVSLLNSNKHMLPVAEDCAFSQRGSISRSDDVCNSSNATSLNQAELWRCVEEAACPIVDGRLQMVVMRDPREMVISAYLHHFERMKSRPQELGSADHFALSLLPTVARRISVCHLLFGKMLEKNSAIFWYDEALAFPRNWHYRFLSFVGLDVPREVVREAAESATSGDKILVSRSKGRNKHQWGNGTSLEWSYRDELEQATLSRMEEILRVWLHPDLLERFGVSST